LIEDSIIDVCLNEEINFKGDWEYINNENQAKLVGSVFNWTHTIYEPGEDTVILKKSGRLFSHTFNKRGIHQIDLDVKNAEECSNKIYEKVFIRVSHIKTDEIDINPPVSCIDIETDIEVSYDPSTSLFPLKTKYKFFTPTIIKDSKICEEDIVSYKTSKKVNSFLPNQTLVNINNFDKVCLKMEHQSVNHITIELQAPNGKTVVLLRDEDGDDKSGNGINTSIKIGTHDPIDSDQCEAFNAAGQGYNYCWSPTPTDDRTWHDLQVFNGGLQKLYPDDPSSRDYRVTPSEPEDNINIYKAYGNGFTQIKDSPLNGEWTLKITDIDDTNPANGYIFDWWIEFKESTTFSNTAYIPKFSHQWESSDTLFSILKKDTLNHPSTPGTYEFKLTLIDSVLQCPEYIDYESVFVPTKVLLDRYESVPDSCENRIGSVLVEGSGGTKPYTYFWNTLDKTDSTVLYLRAGDYPYTITDATNCKHEGIINVAQRSKDVTAAFSFELDTCTSHLNLSNESTNSKYFTWNYGAEKPKYDRDIVLPNLGEKYNVELIASNEHCADTTSQEIELAETDAYSRLNKYLPNVFTPNDDSFNDVLSIKGLRECETGTLKIYNKWGDEVYYSVSPGVEPWDGTHFGEEVAEGTYFYVLKLNYAEFKGTVSLIR
jgi:gliding motility-associated-like protein